MMRRCLHIALALLLCAGASCSRDQEFPVPHEPYPLAFTVSSGQSRAAEGTEEVTNEESRIRSLWVYAFDDNYPAADYYAEPDINGGAGVADEYTVRMDIYDEGAKRFYVIANPPAYIRGLLTASCSEERLRTLTLQMQRPVGTMAELPQNIDGVSEAGDSGFPMANVVTAHAELSESASRQMRLLAPDKEVSITSIPLIRTLGKVVVKAYLRDGNETPVAVTDMKIYNYTADGLFVPVWSREPSQGDWTDDGAWNSDKTLDLAAHARQETKVKPVPASVFSSDKVADESHPGYIDVSRSSKETAREITAFYLCQNSYGRKTDDIAQEGLADVVGNRTSRLVVSLSDGRTTEIQLPYLRRNDRLTVRLGISQYAIRFDFELWNLSDVNPDWSEEITQ